MIIFDPLIVAPEFDIVQHHLEGAQDFHVTLNAHQIVVPKSLAFVAERDIA